MAAALRARLAERVATLPFRPGLRGGPGRRRSGQRRLCPQQGPGGQAAGIDSATIHLPADTSESAVLARLALLNIDPAVDGILVQLPLPPQIRPADGDRRHRPGQGRGRLPPAECRAAGLRQHGPGALHAEGRHAPAAGGRGHAGRRAGRGARPQPDRRPADGRSCCWRPMPRSPSRIPAPATCAAECRRAEILVAAVGRPSWCAATGSREGAVVIDVGINRTPRASWSATWPSPRRASAPAPSPRFRAGSGR